MKIVCLIGSTFTETLARIARGSLPRTEFSELVARHGATMAIFSAAAKEAGFARRLLHLLTQQVRLLVRSGSDEVFIALGEDVGYRAAIALLFQWRRRSPLLVLFHGHAAESKRNRVFLSVLRRIGRVHFLPLSAALADRLVERFGIPSSRVHTTGYGVDHCFFQSKGPRGSTVTSAGLACRDYRTLLEAVRDVGAPVRIAADSAWYQETLDVDHDRIASNVDISSAGDYCGLRDVYEAAEFVVVPLRDVDHACGYAVIYEALSMGRPVVVTKTRAPSDVIVDDVTGLLVPPGDAVALRAAIDRLRHEPALAESLAIAGRATIVASHTLECFTDRIAAVARIAWDRR